jgi:phosphatidate cytidylyltransferase
MAYIVQTNCQRVSSTQARQCILSLGMKRILTALVLIPLVLLMVFVGPRWQWLFTLAVAGVAALAAWEYLGLAEKSGAKPPRVAVLVAVGLLFAGNFAYPDQTAPLFGGLSLGLLIYCTFRSSIDHLLADAATSVFCLLYVGLTLLALPSLREETNGPSLVAFLLCVVWAGDIAALYVGRTLGRLKLAPSLSPNKTWEGTLGSVAGSMAAAGGLVYLSTWLAQWDSARLSYPEDLWYWLGLAVLVNVAAQVGDLAESALKRSVGVKDSGALLPGHGGVLDRVDALLLAAPVLWYAQVIHQGF